MDLRPWRRRLKCDRSPIEVLGALEPATNPFVLVGSWFGGGAIFGDEPTAIRIGGTATEAGAVAPPSPFELLDQPITGDSAEVEADELGVYGGWFGYLGYQTGSLIERLPQPPPRPTPMPTWWLAWHDHVVRFDPDSGWWFEALVGDVDGRLDRAYQRWQARLDTDPGAPASVTLTPFRSTPDAVAHRAAVESALEHIAAGDIYQANVCLRLTAEIEAGTALDLFRAGYARTDARFGAYFDLGEGRALASLSPELFLRRQGRRVSTAPIKGTRPRTGRDGEDGDGSFARELAAAAKDRAENVMIVDLMRNDLGRVCRPGSISVPRLFDVEAHPGVWHLISEVVGTLRAGVGDGELMAATMPPGSVTGAPKVRAMEIISDVESTAREVYTGAIGGVSPVAGAEWNVAIRTFEVSGQDVWLGAGGGIVADSDPAAELAECFTKAAPLIEAIGATLANEA